MATTDVQRLRSTILIRERNPVVRKPPPRRRPLKYVLLAAAIVVSGILLEGLIVRLPTDSGPPPQGERIGAIHVHTKASDGSGTIPQVIAAARNANLSFLGITDHNIAMSQASLASAPSGFELIPGEELSTGSGHFVALGIPPGWKHDASHDAEALLAASHAAGAFNILAHPFSKAIPWKDWKTSDFDAIEIWNDDEVWRRNNAADLSIALLLYTVNDQLAMVRLARTPDRNLQKWDELLATRRMVGMCGSDAHAAIRVGFGVLVPFPGYVPVFRIARTHVLLHTPATAENSGPAGAGILDAIRNGHSYCALDAMQPANGFTTTVSSGNQSAGPGDQLAWAHSGRIRVTLPGGAAQSASQPASESASAFGSQPGAQHGTEPLIRVIHNGQVLFSKQAWSLDEPIDNRTGGPGPYRTEVYLRQPGVTGWGRWSLWIFSNPIYVVPGTAHEAWTAKHGSKPE